MTANGSIGRWPVAIGCLELDLRDASIQTTKPGFFASQPAGKPGASSCYPTAHEVLSTTNPRSLALCRCCKDARLLTDGLRSGSFCPYDPTSGTGRPLVQLYNCYLAGARQCGVDKRFRRGESRFEAIHRCQAFKSGGDAKHGGRSPQEYTVEIQ